MTAKQIEKIVAEYNEANQAAHLAMRQRTGPMAIRYTPEETARIRAAEAALKEAEMQAGRLGTITRSTYHVPAYATFEPRKKAEAKRREDAAWNAWMRS